MEEAKSEPITNPFPTVTSLKPTLGSPLKRHISPKSLPTLPSLSSPKSSSKLPSSPPSLPSLTSRKKIVLPRNNLSYYYYEIQEESNILYLFGKLDKSSIVVKVSDAPKYFYIEAAQDDEINALLTCFLNTIFKNFSITSVFKRNCFGEANLGNTAPRHYYKVSYVPTTDFKRSFSLPSTPKEFGELYTKFSESESLPFVNIHGLSYSLTELFLLDKGIKGPCWLTVSNLTQGKGAVGDTSLVTSSFSDVSIANTQPTPPTLSAAFLSFRSVLDNQSNHIPLLFSVIYYPNVAVPEPDFTKSAVFIRPLVSRDCKQTIDAGKIRSNLNSIQTLRHSGVKFIVCNGESELIGNMIDLVSTLDPDMIAGHALIDFLLPILGERIVKLTAGLKKHLPWFKFGRLIRQQSEIKKSYDRSRKLTSGRLILDTIMGAREFLTRSRSFDLTELSALLFKESRGPSDSDSTIKSFMTSDGLRKLCIASINDSTMSYRIAAHLNLISLTNELSSLTGAPWGDVLLLGRSRRIEWLLLHTFHRDYVVPDRLTQKQKKQEKDEDETTTSKRQPTYAGGLVLEPKRGLYTSCILVLDFLSLYPSIIRGV
ncbi:hypothetical protein GEMRC1_007667 [Eukaryota sp. GEM-RC1]